MDIYGEFVEGGSSLENGGVIDGDLEITQDLTVDGNFEVNGDATFNGTTTIVDEIQVSDPLILTGVGNVSDAINLGVINEHDTNQYSGIVRRATDKRWVALDSVTPKPGPSTVIPPSDSVFECEQLVVNRIESDAAQLDILPFNVRLPSSSFLSYAGLPNQGLISSFGTNLTLQGETRLTLKASDGDLILTSQNNSNADITMFAGRDVDINAGNIVSGSSVNISAPVGDITLSSQVGITLDTSELDLLADFVKVGKVGDDYFLPSDRGTVGQVLTTNGTGNSSWQNPLGFDQTLNTTDSVRFAQLTLGAAGTDFTLPTSRGALGQYMRQNAGGIVSWVDFPETAGGVMYMVGNTLPTVFAASSTYTQIVGTRTGAQLKDFVFAPNVLQYTGAEPGEFLINVSQAWINAGGTPDQYRLAIFKNGAIVASSEQRASLDSDTDYPRSSSTNAIVSLTNGDQVDVRVANFTDTTSVTVVDHTFSIIKVGGGETLEGDVTGPVSSTDNGLCLFDGITGKVLKDSPATLLSTGEMTIEAANARR
jgi:hypothetical protein